MRFATMLAGLTVALAAANAGAVKTDVRAIEIGDYDLGDVRWECLERPLVITNEDELYNAIEDEGAINAISSQVNFHTEKVLYFRWSGSGEDTIKAIADAEFPGGEVTFTYQPGLTLDLTPQHYLFAISNDATWKVKVIVAPAPR